MGNICKRLGIRLGCVKPEVSSIRTVYVGGQSDSSAGGIPGVKYSSEKFPDNTVTSSKYTVWNFLPKNLYEQFRRVANFYFACVAAIQLLIDSPVSPVTSIAPLIFVITVTAVKQGYEDFLRHRADNEVNNRSVDVVRNGELVKIMSKQIMVGDVVRVKMNHFFPCDLVMLSGADDSGECQIQTANLDGETNLKTHNALKETRHLQSPVDLSSFKGRIECEQPHTDLYKFVGRIFIPSEGAAAANGAAPSFDVSRDVKKSVGVDGPQGPNGEADNMDGVSGSGGGIISNEDEACISLNSTNVLLRGARLKDTAFIYGTAVYTGPETKMQLNSKIKSSKFSQVEKYMNYFLLAFLILLFAESLLCTLLLYLYQAQYDLLHYYIPREDKDSTITVRKLISDFLSFMVLFNYIIPISLYVTIELQKFMGSLFFGWDVEMYCPDTNQTAKANTSDLNEELGQIEYLFTDKTGTLTENDMQFRQCAVNDLRYIEEAGMLCQIAPQGQGDSQENLPLAQFTPEIEDLLTVLVLCHTVRVECPYCYEAATGRTASISRSGPRRPSSAPTARPGINACTHTPMDWNYQSSSPDEKAFVEACRRYGVIYRGVVNDWIEVQFRGELRHYEMLHVLEFDPTRKCMSVIVRRVYNVTPSMGGGGDNADNIAKPEEYSDCHYGPFMLLTKGAEMSLLEKALPTEPAATAAGASSASGSSGKEEQREAAAGVAGRVRTPSVPSSSATILNHVNYYAMLGLRTLVIAMRELPQSVYDEFNMKLTNARNALEKREEKLDEAFTVIEQKLRLVGVTAVEDRLQEDVAQTISALRTAGIKVWVLTGDKQETAVNISYSAGHFSSGMQVLYITGQTDYNECSTLIHQHLSSVRRSDGSDEQFALVVDGRSLKLILDEAAAGTNINSPSRQQRLQSRNTSDNDCKTGFLALCLDSVAVLCCRMSPIQKAYVVKLVKESNARPVTAAIGDGANDVSMIQEAHVGLG